MAGAQGRRLKVSVVQQGYAGPGAKNPVLRRPGADSAAVEPSPSAATRSAVIPSVLTPSVVTPSGAARAAPIRGDANRAPTPRPPPGARWHDPAPDGTERRPAAPPPVVRLGFERAFDHQLRVEQRGSRALHWQHSSMASACLRGRRPCAMLRRRRDRMRPRARAAWAAAAAEHGTAGPVRFDPGRAAPSRIACD